MIQTLSFEQIVEFVKSNPEQAVFDWKCDFVPPNDDDKRGEFLKDLAAISNAISRTYGFIVFGVDPRRPDPVLGITKGYDDAKLQQLVKGKIEPAPEFLYYQVSDGVRNIGVLQIKPTHRPHIITVDMGKVRKGQILIRRGSSTDAIKLDDLFSFFYDPTSGYFPSVIENMKAQTQQQLADVARMRESREQANEALKMMEVISGVPKGSSGAKW